jgi:hypothetical protein
VSSVEIVVLDGNRNGRVTVRQEQLRELVLGSKRAPTFHVEGLKRDVI